MSAGTLESGIPSLARLATLEIMRSGASAYTEVEGITDLNWSPTRTTADMRHHGTAGNPLRRGDGFDFACDGSGNYIEDDDGQDQLLECIESGEVATFRYRPLGNTSGAVQRVFSGLVTERPTQSPNEGGATFSFSIEGTGAVTTTTIT